MPPRLVIGEVCGDCHGPADAPTARAATLLERAGHAVIPIDAARDPGAIQHVDLVLLGGQGCEGGVDKLAPYARPRQMFLHTALGEGVQLLDAVETAQAIVMCAHNLFGDVWVTSAADEVGETVVGLLVAEMGGTNLPVADTDRPVIEAAQRLRSLEAEVRCDAYELVRSVVPDVEVVRAQYLAAPAESLPPAGAGQLNRLADAIEDRAVRRVFIDLARRQAERAGDTEAELWAYSKYEGKL